MEKLKLTRVGANQWGHIAYKDESTGKFYLDINNGDSDKPDLYDCHPSDDMDGEPGCPVTREYEIINPFSEREKREKEYEFQYMMLSRLRGECIAYFGNTGDEGQDGMDCRYRNEQFIWGKDIKVLVAEIKRLWEQIPADIKPEWLTWEQITEYERRANE